MPDGPPDGASARESWRLSEWIAGAKALVLGRRRSAAGEKPWDPAAVPLAAPGKFDVVCLPIIEWSFRFQRPQQLMRRLARAGHRVFYVSASFRRAGPPFLLGRVEERLFTVSFRGPERNVYREEMDSRSLAAASEAMGALIARANVMDPVCFVQLPFWEPLSACLRKAGCGMTIYDCMDDHAGFSTNRPAMLASEDRLLREADFVIAASERLESRARERNPRVLLLRNAADVEHFGALARRARSGRPVVGYYGAVAEWLDTQLVADLARRRPDWDFVLVGSTYSADLSPLEGIPNVRLPGEKPYAEIPEWLARFDVCFIPFRRIPLTEATNPVKIYEMFAAGKPVVSVPIPEVAAMTPLARLAGTPEEFEREIEAALAEPPELETPRRRFGAANSWDRRVETLLAELAAIRRRTDLR